MNRFEPATLSAHLIVGLVFLILLAMLLSLPGCTLFNKDVAPVVSKAVIEYCAQPLNVRLAVRTQVNATIAPSHIELTCAGDVATPSH